MDNSRITTDITAYTAEEFLKKFQYLVILGFRLSNIPWSFPMGVFQVEMEAYRPPVRRVSTDGIPDTGPYTEAQMKQMGLEELRRRVREEYNLTDRRLDSLMRKVLKYQKENKCNLSS